MSEVDDDDLDSLGGCWYTLFALHNRDTCRTVQEIDLQDHQDFCGDSNFTAADLDRLIARTHELQSWMDPFEGSGGNPIFAIALVASWPKEDIQSFPRLVTAYWPHFGPDTKVMKEAALELIKRFNANPLESMILEQVKTSIAAAEALVSVLPN